MLRVRVAERNIAARRVIRRKRENDILAGAVIDARGLEQKSIGRIEQSGEELNGRKIARETDEGKCRCMNEPGNSNRKYHPCAEKDVAGSRFLGALTGKPPVAPRPQDRNGGGHGISIQGNKGEGKESKKEKGLRERGFNLPVNFPAIP